MGLPNCFICIFFFQSSPMKWIISGIHLEDRQYSFSANFSSIVGATLESSALSSLCRGGGGTRHRTHDRKQKLHTDHSLPFISTSSNIFRFGCILMNAHYNNFTNFWACYSAVTLEDKSPLSNGQFTNVCSIDWHSNENSVFKN